MTTHNPLLQRTSLIPFDAISAQHIVPAIDALLAEARQELEALKGLAGTRTFENTLLALDNLGLNLNYAMSVVGHLESVATTPELRAAYNEILPKVKWRRAPPRAEGDSGDNQLRANNGDQHIFAEYSRRHERV